MIEVLIIFQTRYNLTKDDSDGKEDDHCKNNLVVLTSKASLVKTTKIPKISWKASICTSLGRRGNLVKLAEDGASIWLVTVFPLEMRTLSCLAITTLCQTVSSCSTFFIVKRLLSLLTGV